MTRLASFEPVFVVPALPVAYFDSGTLSQPIYLKKDLKTQRKLKLSSPRSQTTSVWKSGPVRFFDPSGLRPRPEPVHANIDFTKNRTGLTVTGLLRFLCGSTTGFNQFRFKLVL